MWVWTPLDLNIWKRDSSWTCSCNSTRSSPAHNPSDTTTTRWNKRWIFLQRTKMFSEVSRLCCLCFGFWWFLMSCWCSFCWISEKNDVPWNLLVPERCWNIQMFSVSRVRSLLLISVTKHSLLLQEKQHVAAMLQRQRDEPDKAFTNSTRFAFLTTGKFSAESCLCLDKPSPPSPPLPPSHFLLLRPARPSSDKRREEKVCLFRSKLTGSISELFVPRVLQESVTQTIWCHVPRQRHMFQGSWREAQLHTHILNGQGPAGAWGGHRDRTSKPISHVGFCGFVK